MTLPIQPLDRLSIVIIGLSITSSWGNGHATTYRALVAALADRGHDVVFLERDVPWYAAHRDLPNPPFGRTCLYDTPDALRETWRNAIREADLVIVGSYVPDGIEIGHFVTGLAKGVTAFYDIDTPVTLAALADGGCAYLSTDLVPRYNLYLSFTGGPALEILEDRYRSPMARPLYCSVDPSLYKPQAADPDWDFGYLGTYSSDRQPTLDKLLVDVAHGLPGRRFVVAGPQYPDSVRWPENVARIEHLPPDLHRQFYARQRFTLNVTRAAMIEMGYSPSVRLFEAASCGVPIVSDWWTGLDTLFVPGSEILIARSTADVTAFLTTLSDDERLKIAENARARVLDEHTPLHRAIAVESYWNQAACRRTSWAATA